MLSLFNHWRSKLSADNNKIEKLLNPQTQASQATLIALQGYARRFDLRHAKFARAQILGSFRSTFRGRGMDYQESRVYQAGDDIRNMDWRVTARSGRAHTKLFQEERERPLLLFVDFSPSLFFATQGSLKSVVAAKAATMLAWVAATQGDRIGGLIFNDGFYELKARTGQHGVLPFIHALVEHSDPIKGLSNNTQNTINDGLLRLRRIVKPGSLVIMLSDFYSLNEQSKQHLLPIRQHSDLFALQILDPIEKSAPAAGQYPITDGEQESLLDTQSRSSHENYEQHFSQQQKALEKVLSSSSVPLMQLLTTDNVIERLQQQFTKKRKKASA